MLPSCLPPSWIWSLTAFILLLNWDMRVKVNRVRGQGSDRSQRKNAAQAAPRLPMFRTCVSGIAARS
jgi:hypothetical protein